MHSGQGLIAWLDCPAAEKRGTNVKVLVLPREREYRVTLLGEALSLNRGTCGGDRAFVVLHIAAFTHEAYPFAGQLLKLLSGQRTGGDARLIGGGAGGNMLKPEFIHFVGVAGTQRLGMFTCLADVLVQARMIVLKLIGGNVGLRSWRCARG